MLDRLPRRIIVMIGTLGSRGKGRVKRGRVRRRLKRRRRVRRGLCLGRLRSSRRFLRWRQHLCWIWIVRLRLIKSEWSKTTLIKIKKDNILGCSRVAPWGVRVEGVVLAAGDSLPVLRRVVLVFKVGKVWVFRGVYGVAGGGKWRDSPSSFGTWWFIDIVTLS